MTSPGTISRPGTVSLCPSRMTCASGAASRRSAESACSARELLDHPQGSIEQHDGQDDDRLNPVTQHGGDQRRRNQHDNQKALELCPQAIEKARALGFGQLVGPVASQPAGGFVGRQASFRRSLEGFHHLAAFQCMPDGRWGWVGARQIKTWRLGTGCHHLSNAGRQRPSFEVYHHAAIRRGARRSRVCSGRRASAMEVCAGARPIPGLL